MAAIIQKKYLKLQPNFTMMNQENEKLIDLFFKDELNKEQKEEFVKLMATNRGFLKSAIQKMELDEAIEDSLKPKQ